MSDIFDQLAGKQPATNEAVPTSTPGVQTPVSQPQPTQGQGDVFDQLSNGATPQPSQTSQQPQQAPAQQPEMFSAVPDDTTADHVKNWANSVIGDLRHGSTTTILGSLLQKLGANPNGLEGGVAPGVADFMGSLPLGLLRATKGAAEATQPGHRWAGVKDTIGGLSDAATIPGSFVAPEAGELAGAAGDIGLTQASNAAKAVSGTLAKTAGKFDVHSVQAPLQAGIRQTLAAVAKDAGVTPAASTSIRDVAAELSTAIRAKSSELYSQLDAATGGGRFQRFSDSLSNIEQAMRDALGVDPERFEDLTQRKGEVEAAQKAALDAAKATGVDPGLITEANATWKQHAALSDLSNTIRQSVQGMRPEIAGAKATPETVNAKTLFAKINRLYDKGRLADALGEDNAATLMQHVDTAYLLAQKIANRNKWLGAVFKAAGLGGVGAAGYEAVKAVGGPN